MAALGVMGIIRNRVTGAQLPSIHAYRSFASEPPNKPDWQMFWIVKNGVRYSGMGAWDGEISDDKIWQVVMFLSRLNNLPPEVQVDWVQQPK